MRKVLLAILLILGCLLLIPLVYAGYQAVHLRVGLPDSQVAAPELTPAEKEADFRYLTRLVREVYPYADSVARDKGLDNIVSLEADYIARAGQTRDNQEFLALFYEYIVGLKQAGHVSLLFDPHYDLLRSYLFDIPKTAQVRADYWAGLAAQLPWYAHSDLQVEYRAGRYVLREDGSVGKMQLPAGTTIQQVDGRPVDDYVRSLQHRQPLRLDPATAKVYLADPFMIDPGPQTDGWDVTFTLPDGSKYEGRVDKVPGYRDARRASGTSYPNVVCRDLNGESVYLRIFSFEPAHMAEDRAAIQGCLQAAPHQYAKLIIDVRGNAGGEPSYWMDLLVQPLLKQPAGYQDVAAVRKGFFQRLGFRYDLYRRAFKDDLLDASVFHIRSVEPIQFRGLDAGEWNVYQITRELAPQDTLPFDGQVYVLVDNDSASATDGFAQAVRKLKLAKVVGTNTAGGINAFSAPWTFALPNSGLSFQMDVELGITADGRVNQTLGTPPDVTLEPSSYPTAYPASLEVDALLRDPWVKWVLEDR
jgi:hypothetical protein